MIRLKKRKVIHPYYRIANVQHNKKDRVQARKMTERIRGKIERGEREKREKRGIKNKGGSGGRG